MQGSSPPSTIYGVFEKEGLYKVEINRGTTMFCLVIYTVEREWKGEIAAPGGGGAARLFWRQIGYSLSIPSGYHSQKYILSNILVIIGSVLGKGVNS